MSASVVGQAADSNERTCETFIDKLRIPANVTADSGNVTGVPVNVTDDWCCAF